MKQEFINRILREGIVDTENYRYIKKECHNHETQWIEIRRLPLSSLDTTAALSDWETVEVMK